MAGIKKHGELKPTVQVWASEVNGRWTVQINTFGDDGHPQINVDLNDGRIWDAGPVGVEIS